MPVIPVPHATGSYPVYVEPGALGRLNEFSSRHLIGRRLALISDTNVYPLFERFRSGGGSERRPPPPTPTVSAPVSLPQLSAELIIPAGEASKTRDRWAELSDALLERGFGRDSAIVALGGGMVGDLAGFVAATYLRGIPCIEVQTPLLAMVDASVGGKTGVDTARGKNLIGGFHPPAAVVADPLAL